MSRPWKLYRQCGYSISSFSGSGWGSEFNRHGPGSPEGWTPGFTMIAASLMGGASIVMIQVKPLAHALIRLICQILAQQQIPPDLVPHHHQFCVSNMEPNLLPDSFLFPLIVILILALIHFPATFCQQTRAYDACGETLQCGGIDDVGYPFWGLNRPAYCGQPGFQLTCESEVFLLSYQNLQYRVLQVDSSTQIITFARNDLWVNSCPQFLYNTTYNSTLFNDNNLGNEDVSLYYGCNSFSGPLPSNLNQFQCTMNDTTASTNYFITTSVAESSSGFVNILMQCNNNIVVPVNQTWGQRFASAVATDSDLRSALTAGFRLQWTANNTECDQCVRSGGRCGSNSTSSSPFTCYCANGNFSLTCNNSPVDSAGSGGGSSNNGSLSIALPIAGAVLAGVGIGWGIFVCRQRRKKRIEAASAVAAQTSSKDPAFASKGLSTTPSSNFTTSIPSYPSSRTTTEFGKSTYFGAQVFSYEELEIATDNFNTSRELGDGGFGTVYYGKLIDGREVAVKRLHENNFKRLEQFLNEVEILTRLNHGNLVKLYGCTSKRSRELLLVYEYIANGTVADHLHGKLANSRSGLLTWSVRLNIAIETADALAYLHQSDIIHRDVKTNNILLDKNFRVKVADFGLSRLFPNNATHVSTAPQGTPGYVDPEYYQCYQLTDKSDVYSFGVVLIELISSLQAVDTNRHRHDINLANMAINKIQNHTLDELVDKSMGFENNPLVRRMATLVAVLAFRCLQQEKDMRPTMEEVLETLRGIQNEELNSQKPEVLDIVVDDGVLLKDNHTDPPSPDSGVTDKLVDSTVPNSSRG